MMKLVGFTILALALAGARARDASADDPAPALRRYALIVSSNGGGRDRPRLRYADSDARAMADVLRELGGLRAEDLVLAPNATRATITASFRRLRDLLDRARTGPRREVVIYYSGHSDEESLLLAGERVSYRELREWIHGTGADVRIAILDSCASGALIRQRGGTRTASFLGDRSVEARGHAFLTASSADEAAQESDRIGAAFFTHYLVSGLRGAADINRDGIVTLAEGYQFAYHETLRRTEQTAAGAQHATYDIQLAGIGDLVLTDLRATSSSLQLDTELAGRVSVRDATGRLVVELHKHRHQEVALALAPGSYTVAAEHGGERRVGAITVERHRPARVRPAQLAVATRLPAVARGGAPASAPAEELDRPGTFLANPSWRRLGGHAGLVMRYSRLGRRDGFNPGAEFALRYRHLALGIAGGGVVTSADASGRAWTLGYGGVVARYELQRGASPFYLSIGALAAAGDAHAEVAGAAAAGAPPHMIGDGLVWIFEPQLTGHLNLTRWLRVGLDVGYRFVAAPGPDLSGRDLRGVTGGVHMQLGWF